MKLLLIGLFYLLNLCAVSLSLHCYVCNSEVDEACSDPFRANSNATRESFWKDCNQTAAEEPRLRAVLDDPDVVPLCRKVLTYVQSYYINMERVQRECGYKWRKGDNDYAKRAEDYQLYTYQCGTDGCNTAPLATASKTALLLVPFFTYRYV